MDIDTLFKGLQQFGALAILDMMVWRAPNVITVINQMIQDNIKNVREVQTEALTVFKGENDKILNMVSERFKTVEDVLKTSVETQTEVLGEMKMLTERVRNLENDKPK